MESFVIQASILHNIFSIGRIPINSEIIRQLNTHDVMSIKFAYKFIINQ